MIINSFMSVFKKKKKRERELILVSLFYFVKAVPSESVNVLSITRARHTLISLLSDIMYERSLEAAVTPASSAHQHAVCVF